MIIKLKKYLKCLCYRFGTKIETDDDFYECDEFYLIDMECDKRCLRKN